MLTRHKFTKEFKKEAVELVLSQSLRVKEAASELGIGYSTLDRWVRDYKKRKSDPNALQSENELAELERLRKENRVLKMERDLLKKTMVYFAKATQPDVIS